MTRFPLSLRHFDKLRTCLSVEAEIQNTHCRQVDLTDEEFLGQKTGGVTPHSIFDSCRPTAANFGAHGASGPVRCVLSAHGCCRAPLAAWSAWTCGTLLSPQGWSHSGAGRRVRWALSSEEKYLVVTSFLTVQLFGSLSMTQKRRVTEGSHKHVTS